MNAEELNKRLELLLCLLDMFNKGILTQKQGLCVLSQVGIGDGAAKAIMAME